MWGAVVEAYLESIEKYPDLDLYNGMSAYDAALENMRLVYLRREPNAPLWTPPEE